MGKAVLDFGGRGRGVGVGDASFVVDKGFAEAEMADDREGKQDALDGQGTSGGRVVSGCDCEEADQTTLREIDTGDELSEGTLVGTALGVDVGLVAIEEVVAESNVDESKANGGETQDKRSNATVRECNDAKVSPLRELRAPSGCRELDKLLPDLAGSLAREDAAEENNANEATDVE